MHERDEEAQHSKRSAWRRVVAATAAIGCVGGVLALAPPQVQAAPAECNRQNDTVAELLFCVTPAGVLQHERAFQEIADENGGNRASGLPGYDASVDYVADKMRDAGYRVTVQPFTFNAFIPLGPATLEQTAPNQVTYVQGTDYGVLAQSDPGEVTAPVTVVDIQLGLGNTSTSGCEATDFTGFPAGNIALLQRGTCTFEDKIENAAAAGAVGAIFFNQGETTDPSRQGIPAVTLGNGNTSGIPGIGITYALGAQLSAISGLTMHMDVDVLRGPAETYNVIAESRKGNGNNVIMAGAHLDSVPAGPGINDNGSGSSALLEVALQMAKVRPRNKVRFAWWGAEEASLVGSTHYVTDLVNNDPEALEDIEMYLNFDMVGSPNYGLFVYDGDGDTFGIVGPDGSDDIEALFERYYAERDIPSRPTAFSGRSDYQAFINNGVPAGGLFTGAEGIKTAAEEELWGGTAGIAYDPCYHQACDTIDNVNRDALRINADAVAYVVINYAMRYEALTPSAP